MTLFNFVPSGTILPFGGVTAPAGWLLCDGSAISRTTYANLYSAIGVVWGSGDGSSTFHLPDLRGRFIRGRDGGAARDPDRTARTAANTGGNTGDNVGSVQDNATAKNGLSATAGTSVTPVSGLKNQMNGGTGGASVNHSHGIGSDGSHAHNIQVGWSSSGEGRAFEDSGSYNQNYSTDSAGAHSHGGGTGGHSVDHSHSWDFGAATFSASGTTPAQAITVGNGDNETRPKNANVNYIIKI